MQENVRMKSVDRNKWDILSTQNNSLKPTTTMGRRSVVHRGLPFMTILAFPPGTHSGAFGDLRGE